MDPWYSNISRAESECTKIVKDVRSVAKRSYPDDNDAVSALPDDWVPRRSGPILFNFLKQREELHQITNNETIKRAALINEEIDEKVRTLSENLLAHIKQNQSEINCVAKKVDANSVTLADVTKRIHELRQIRIDDFETFKREASDLERNRADKLKMLLRETFQRLVSAGYMVPKNILHDFDQRIYEINQQLLNNSRAFLEVEAKLRIQLNESIICANSSINQLILDSQLSVKLRSTQSATNLEVELPQSKQAISTSVDQEFSAHSIVPLLLGESEQLEIYINKLVQAYRTAVLKLSSGFCDKLDSLEKDLNCNRDLINHIDLDVLVYTDFNNLINKPLRRISNSKLANTRRKTVLELTGADVEMMQKSLQSLGDYLTETFSVLHDSGHVCDAHILRSALAKKLTIAAVEDLLTTNDSIEIANSVNINIAIEQLRCSPNIDKLNYLEADIIAMLEKVAEQYLHHCESELGRLGEFISLSPYMSNTLLSEFNVFFAKHPRSSFSTEVPFYPQTPTPTRQHPTNTPRWTLPRAILQTNLQGVALKNWKKGFLESFQANIPSVPEELKRQAELWIEERSKPLHMRYSLKMMSHGIRIERIKALAENRRLELRYHESRLQSHLEAVYYLVQRLPEEASGFASIDAHFLYPLVKWIKIIQSHIDDIQNEESINAEIKKLKFLSYSARLSQYRTFFVDSLEKAVSEYKHHLEYRLQEARISNVRFISHIKLFSEGGRYAVNEATMATLALTKASDALELCWIKTAEALENRRIDLLNQADMLLAPLISICGGVTVATVKKSRK